MARLATLTEYRDLTAELLDCVTVPDDELNTDRLEELLTQRDRVITAHDEAGLGAVRGPEIEAVLTEIQRLDMMFRTRLTNQQKATQNKLGTMQAQKRATNAYQPEYTYDAAFIDRKK